MQINSCILDGGVKLTTLKTDKFKSNLMTVELLCPLSEDTATHNSLITNVLSRCCAMYPTLREFNIALEKLYAADLDAFVSKCGETQKVCFKLSCIENKYTYDGMDVFENAMMLLGEMIFKPLLENGVFPDSVVEGERRNLREEIESVKDDQGRYALRRCIETMCAEEPYSVNVGGDIKVLEGITAAELKQHYDVLLQTAPVSIYFVGSTDMETVKKYAEKYLPFGKRQSIYPQYDTNKTPVAVNTVTEQADAVQSRLCMGFRTNLTLRDDAYAALLLATEILGSPAGKLFVNVREKQGLCYYCSPILDGQKGLLIISAGIDSADREKAQSAILEQIEEVKNGNISDAELAFAKKSAASSYKEIYDSPSAMISWYANRSRLGIENISPERMAALVAKQTKADIAAAASLLKADTFFLLEGGDDGEL